MRIHRFEKLWLLASLVLIIALIATITYGAVGVGVTMVNDQGGTLDPDRIDQHPEFSDPGVSQVGENRYDVYVVARQFLFQPGTAEPIRVPAGSTVTFLITSADVIHGFEIVGTNVNVMAVPGQITEITVEFDEPRQYGIVCHEYCGSGHHTMEGSIEVVPQAQFNADTAASAAGKANATGETATSGEAVTNGPNTSQRDVTHMIATRTGIETEARTDANSEASATVMRASEEE